MNYLSICSGIEAATVAWHPLGWAPLAFSEIEVFPSAVLAHHYPTIPNLGDMTKFHEWDVELLSEEDILVGGTPCQAFSVAGLRAGLDDERGQLTLTYIRLLDHIDSLRSFYGREPAIAVWENVPGVLSSKDNAFGAFLGGLAGEDCELLPSGGKWTNAGCVYGSKRTIAWRVLDAQYFGVAQRRKRVFVVASARNIDPSEILFEFDGVRRDTPPSRTEGQETSSNVGNGVNECSYSIIADETPKIGEEVCGTLRSQGGGGIVPPSVAYAVDVVGTLCHSYHKGVGNQYVADGKVIAFHPTQTPINSTDGMTHSMGYGSSHGQASIAVAIQGSMIGRESHNGPQGNGLNEEVSFTLNCTDRHAVCLMDQGGSVMNVETEITGTLRRETHGHEPSVVCPSRMQVRRLTPVECERLQGFPDGYTNIPWSEYKKELKNGTPFNQIQEVIGSLYLEDYSCSDGNRYKALGNSMAVPVMRWIGERIAGATL